LGHYFFSTRFAKIINDEWLWSIVYEGYCLAYFGERYYGQDGAEDFLIKNGRIRVRVKNYSRLNSLFLNIYSTPNQNLPTRRLYQLINPPYLLPINNPPILSTLQLPPPINNLYLFQQVLNHLLQYTLMDYRIISSYTDLPSVKEFTGG